MPPRRRNWTLYPANKAARLDLRQFRDPPAEYRGAPFWSWNAKLDRRRLLEQIDRLARMGFGGFHMHARTGLADEYLGRRFMSAVRACVAHATRGGMRAWLYDEDRWPSGFAGGLVTRDPRFRQKLLLWTTRSQEGLDPIVVYEVSLDTSGRLRAYRRCSRRSQSDQRKSGSRGENSFVIDNAVQSGSSPAAQTPAWEGSDGSRVWFAYLVPARPESWFNDQTYIDTFDADAVRRFIEVTHVRYADAVGDEFGKTIPAIFTDEPHFHKKPTFQHAEDTRDLLVPFTPDLPETFKAAYGFDLLDHLPEIFWNLPDDAPSRARYCWHDHTAERFASAFGDTIARWCGRRGIALTGHMLSEATLFGQTRAVGEVMRAMRSFQLPGIDILEDKKELTTAKQAQSLARQLGRPGVLSELYGVTGWDFDFAGHKRQGDWQAALGVTVRVPHLAWMSMAGEAKRDYPAAIDYHSPWFAEYPLVEDHFARLNTVLTRGRPAVRVGVIHPIESFWMCFGAIEQNADAIRQIETEFADLTEWLVHGLIDFDFVSESLLPRLGRAGGRVGRMRYDAIVLPNLRTIRSTTLDFLRRFTGMIVVAGAAPQLVDARPSRSPAGALTRATRIPFSRHSILSALEPCRDLDVRLPDGGRADSLVHQLRADGKARHLFIANTDHDRSAGGLTIRVAGKWRVTRLDTFAGTSHELASDNDGTRTVFRHALAAHDHLLVRLDPNRGKSRPAAPRRETSWREVARIDAPVPVSLSEPNVLLLDQAQWRIDGGRWNPREEILRLDNLARNKLGLPPRGGNMAQPWTDRAPAPVAERLELKFRIESDVPVRGARLALEESETATILLNGRVVRKRDAGWWVDESIRTIPLPELCAGRNELILSIPLTRRTNVEWCYLLGDFGVRVAGRDARLVAPVRKLAFGDWTTQGLPFYVGNVTYHGSLRSGRSDRLAVQTPHFRNPLLSVDRDGQAVGKIAFAPYRLDLGRVPPGRHRLDITAFGHRHNAFGPLHHTNPKLSWIGPAAWRSTGTNWSYEYHLKPMGILGAPIVLACD